MLKRFYRKHKEWFTLFSSAFVGTLLGIGLTFGISGLLAQKEEEDVANKFLHMSLDHVDKTIGLSEEMLSLLQHTDSILGSTLEYYPYRAAEFPDTLAGQLGAAINHLYFQLEDNMTEQIFFNNIKTIEVFDDLSIVTDMRNLYVITHGIEQCKKALDQIIAELSEELYKKQNPVMYTNQEAIQVLFDYPKYEKCVTLYHVYTEVTRQLIEKLKKENRTVMKNLGIDDSEVKHVKKFSGVEYEF